MLKTLTISLLVLVGTSALVAQIAGHPGAFARMGYHARGMAMGNALTAVTVGDLHTHYNPAVAPFASRRLATASFGILSLDRRLNFLDYVHPAPPTAGVSLGLINAGVGKIDGRDNDGYHTEMYSTSENQFFLSFANRFDERVSLGVTVKLYYHKLFEEVSTTTVGFDAGALVTITNEITVGFAIQDIGSKYRWDTSPIYGRSGTQLTDEFPRLYRGGVAYRLPGNLALVSADLEFSSEKTTVARMGTEFPIHENVLVRGGLDRWDLKDNTTGTKPSLGFGLRRDFDGWTPSIDYAFLFEPFAPGGIHVISLALQF